jgi:hypothetical protein
MAVVTMAAAGAKGGASVLAADIRMPRAGAWIADLVVDAEAPLTGKVHINLSPNRVLVGTLSRAEVHEGRLRAQVVAGANGLRKKVKAKHYTSPTVGVVWRDLLADVGETPAPTADQAVLGAQLTHWTTMRLPAGQVIRTLVPRGHEEGVWRHLPDGTLWTGLETWPASVVLDYDQVGGRPEEARVDVALVDADLLPGTKLGEWRIGDLEMRVGGGQVRATLWTVP